MSVVDIDVARAQRDERRSTRGAYRAEQARVLREQGCTYREIAEALGHNLEWDPREEHAVDFPHAWVAHPVAAAAGTFLASLATEPPIKPGTPDPYTPPSAGEWSPQATLQIGPITQYLSTLVSTTGVVHQPDSGLEHQAG
jgi:arylsulfatase